MAGEPTALLKGSILRSYLLMNMLSRARAHVNARGASFDPGSELKLFISHNKHKQARVSIKKTGEQSRSRLDATSTPLYSENMSWIKAISLSNSFTYMYELAKI